MISNFTFSQIVLTALTEREIEILHLYAVGYSKKEIAKILTLSIKTIDRHLDNIGEKINTKWTPATSPRAVRLSIVWHEHKDNIINFSKEKGLIK